MPRARLTPRLNAQRSRHRASILLAAAALATAAGAPAQPVEPTPQVIVITATRRALAAWDAPASLSVVDAREIQARGADDLLDTLRGEAGVSLQARAVAGRKVLSLRGMDSKHTLYLVDGRRIGASDGTVGASDFQYDWIAVDDIERIEVVRGPLSVLYGSEAMGGVVNVVTRQPGEHWRAGARVEGRWADGGRGGDGHRAGAQVDGPLAAGLWLKAGAALSRRDAVASPADPRLSELESHDKRDGWAGLIWQPAPTQRVALDLHVGDETRSADARERGGQRRYHRTDNLIQRGLASLGWDAEWGTGAETLTTQLRGYRNVLDVRNERTAGVTPNIPQRLTDTVAEGQATARFGAHTATAGFEARDETLRDEGLPQGSSTARHRAAFVQDEWALSKAVMLTLGLRQDDHSLFGGQTSPRAYAVWRLDPHWTLKGGYSHGFKAPNLKQIVPGSRREGPNTFIGNPALRPETSDALELGVSWQAGRIEAQLTAFDQRVHDLIEVRLVTPGPTPGLGTYTYENLARALLRGLESSLALPLAAGFTTQVSWTVLDARAGDGTRLERRPRHAVGARLDWSGGPWRAGLRVDHSAGQQLADSSAGGVLRDVPDLTTVAAYLQRELAHGLRLQVGIDNLTGLRPADKSPLYLHAEPPRAVRIALSGRW